MVRYCGKHNQRFYAKRVIILACFAVVLLCTMAFSMTNSAYAAGANSSKCMVEVTTGRVLYGENMNIQLPMASTTKAMTALLAVESGKMNEVVTVTKASVGIEGSSIYLKEGDKITLEALTYGLMLRSGNDAAETIAIYLAGTIDKFSDMMNEKATELGLKNTHFVNPHGLHDEKHYTSAYDLAVISASGLKNPHFKKITSTKSITFDQNGKKWQFVNKNKLLFNFGECTGVKTGYTKKAGRCLIASSERNNLAVVVVVLNVAPMFEECTRLMNFAHKNYEMKTIIKAGEVVAGVPISGINYRKATLTVKNDVRYPLKKDGSEQCSVRVNTIKEIPLGFDRDTEAGKAQIFINNQLLFSENLFMIK